MTGEMCAAYRRSRMTPLRPVPARIMLTERANLVIIPFVQEDVTVRAEIFILCNPWPADRQKPHGYLLYYGPLLHVQMQG